MGRVRGLPYFKQPAIDKKKLQKEIRDLKIDILVNQLTLNKISFQDNNPKLGGFAPTPKEIQKNLENEIKMAAFDNTIQKLLTLKKNKDAILHFFDWKLDFPEVMNDEIVKREKGFDIVIGNPPYVGEKGYSHIFEELKKIPKWITYYRRRSNTYYFFIKLGIDLLKQSGVQSLITPREFTTADWSNKVRQIIIEESIIVEIIDFENSKVFKEAGTSSLILLHKKYRNSNYEFKLKSLNVQSFKKGISLNNIATRLVNIESLTSNDFKPWLFADSVISITKNLVPLGELFEISQGIVTGADRVTPKHVAAGLISPSFLNRGIFILKENVDIKFKNSKTWININDSWIELNQSDKKLIKPFYKTESLGKWIIDSTNTYVIYIGEENLTVNIENYLLQFATILVNRATLLEDKIITLKEFEKLTSDGVKILYSSAGAVQKVMKKKKWYLPLYERANVPFDGSKIIVNTKNMNVFTYSNQPVYSSGGGAGGQNFIYHNNSNYFRSQNEGFADLYTRFVCAVLNSKLLQSYIKSGKYNQLSTYKIGSLPIPKIDFNSPYEKNFYDGVLLNINKLLNKYLKSEKPTYNANHDYERVIDFMVYKLYHLTWGEACIIEGNSTWMSENEYENFKIQ